MASNLIRFEIVLPNVDVGTLADNAIRQFINNMLSLCQLTMVSAYIYPIGGNANVFTSQFLLYGLITLSQQNTAIGYLNTLNASLGFNVQCLVFQVQTQP
jgi:hypothetical protein